MSLLESPNATGIRQLLRKLEDEDVMGIARTATNNRIVPQDTKEAVDVILTYTPDLGRFFSYRRIKSQALFDYLISKNVVVDCQSSKMQLIAAVQDLWEKNAKRNSQTRKGEKKCTASSAAPVQSNISVTLNNISVNIGEKVSNTGKENISSSRSRVPEDVSNITNLFRRRRTAETHIEKFLSTSAPSQPPVRTIRSDEFSREFCKWYYTMVNRLQPGYAHLAGDTLREEVFLGNSSAEVYIYGPTTTQRSAVGPRDTYTLLRDIFTEYKILFSPNVDSGIQSYAIEHGLIKLLVCGTLHQENSLIGIFEQEFGLVQSPVERAWKIMITKLNLKQAGETTPTLPKSQVFEITVII